MFEPGLWQFIRKFSAKVSKKRAHLRIALRSSAKERALSTSSVISHARRGLVDTR